MAGDEVVGVKGGGKVGCLDYFAAICNYFLSFG